MKRTLALILCFCLLFSLAPLSGWTRAQGEGWTFRYAGEDIIPQIAVWIFDAAMKDYTLSPDDYSDYDPETYEPISAYTVPTEKTGNYWEHTSLASREELFPGNGPYYAVICIPADYMTNTTPQIILHPLTAQEQREGLTVTEDMRSSLAQLSITTPGTTAEGSSELSLFWQSGEGASHIIDLSPVMRDLQSGNGSYAAAVTPGYFTAVNAFSTMDYGGGTFSYGPAVVDYRQFAAETGASLTLTADKEEKRLFTAVLPSGAKAASISVALPSGVEFPVMGGNAVYLEPGAYDLGVSLYTGSPETGVADEWVYDTHVDLRTGDRSVTYSSLADLASFTREVKVYADEGYTTLRSTVPAAGGSVFVDYLLTDPQGNRLMAIITASGAYNETFVTAAVTAGGTPVTLSGGSISFARFAFTASQPEAEYTVTLAPTLNYFTVNVSDTFTLNNGSALADVVPNPPGSLAVTASRAGDSADFTWTAATHPNPNASVTAYRLYRCDAAGTVSGTYAGESTGLSLHLDGLTAVAGEEEAYFTLRAFDGVHESENANVVRIPALEEGVLTFAQAQGAVLGTDSLRLTETNGGALAVTMEYALTAGDPAAVLSYTRPDGSTATASVPMTAVTGGYGAELPIPADAAVITGVQAAYTTAGGTRKTVSRETRLEVIAGTLTVTMEKCAPNRDLVSTAALTAGGRQAGALSREDIQVSGDDLVLFLRSVPRTLYREGAQLNLGTTLGSRGFPAAIAGDALTIDREQVQTAFGLPYTIRLEVDGSAMNGAAYRLTADVDVYYEESLLSSSTFAGITESRDLTFHIQGQFDYFRITFRDPAEGTYKLTYDDTHHTDSFTCPVKVEPYTVESGSVIPITMDGEPFGERIALKLIREDLWSRTVLWYPGSSMADLSSLEDGVYTVSPYQKSCVEFVPVTVTVQNGAIVGECPPLELYSQVYYSVAVKNVLQGSGIEYSANYDVSYRRNGSAEWVSCPATACYDTSDYGAARLDPAYSGNLFIGPFRYVDVKDASGAADLAELRIVPRGTLWRLYGEPGGVEAAFGETLVDLTVDTQTTVVNNHEELLTEPRIDVYIRKPLTFTGSAYPLHKVRVHSPGATAGQVQLNLFLFGVDSAGEPNGRTYSRTFILEKFNEAAYQEIDDTASLYEPGSYWALYYTGPHDATKENTFLLSKAAVYGTADRVFAVAYLGDGQVNEEIVYLPAETAADTFIASFSADSAQVTGSDIVGFLYTFTGDETLSGQTLTFTLEGGWAAPAKVTDLRASVTVDGAAKAAPVTLAEGKLTVTLPEVKAGQRVRGTVRLGYTAASVPADGQLTASAKLGEETRYAYSRRISFTHNLPETTNAAAIAASGRGNWAGEKCFIAFYTEDALCGAYELSKYGYWGGGFGEYRDIALPVGEKDTQRTFALRAYRVAAASLGALPASPEGLANPLGEQTVTYRRTARNILPARYILRYINETDGNAEEISLTDPQQFKARTLTFGQDYDTHTLELILDFAGDVSNDITDPQVVVRMGGYRFTFYTTLEKADSSGTRYAAAWAAEYNGPMTVQYQQRPELYGDTHSRPEPVSFQLGSTLSELEMARLRAAYAKLKASPDKSGSAGGSKTFRNDEKGVELTLSVNLSAAILGPQELQARLDALDTENEHAMVLDLQDDPNSDIQYIYILPTSFGPGDQGYVERNDGREYYRVGYTYVVVYKSSAFEEQGAALMGFTGPDGEPSADQTKLMVANQFLGDINGPVGYFGTAKNALEFSGAKEGLLNDIPFQADNKFNERLGYLGDAGAIVGIADKLVNDSDIAREQQEVIQQRIADINGMYAFAMAKCKCDDQAELRKINLTFIRDTYITKLKNMSTDVNTEEVACDLISSGKDAVVTVAGKVEDPAVQLAVFAVDKGVDAAIDSYRYGKNIERYDKQDEWVVQCGKELDAAADTCNKKGCDVGELKRKAPKLVEADPNQDYSGFGIALGRQIPIEPKIIIDPSGIVYEGYLGNPLAGVECVVYESDDGTETGTFHEWLDAPGFDGQASRQTTGESGYYEWYVPAGMWKVTYTKAGYLPAESAVMQVAPQWLDVNQNLLAEDNRAVMSLSSAEGKVILAFTKPVVLEDILNGGLDVTIGGVKAKGAWTVSGGGEGSIYGDGVMNAPTGTGMLVRELVFTPDTVPQTGKTVSAAPAGDGVRSYGGTLLAEEAVTGTINGGYTPWNYLPQPETESAAETEAVSLLPQGGEITALDGDIRLVSEEGTVSTETKVTLTKSEGGEEALSPVYGVRFAVQPSDTVEVRFRLADAAEDVEEPLFLGLWVKPDGAEDWEFAGGAYDPETNSLTLLTRVSGEYKAMYSPVDFQDVPADHWAKKYIDVLAARRIMEGDGVKANPEAEITRAEVAALAVRVLQANSLLGRTPEVRDNFLDVKREDWFWYEVNLAAKRGIVQGFEGYMRPNDPITREELAAIIARMAADAQALAEERSADFGDAAAIADWARTYVAVLQEMGFLQGDENGNFNHAAHATRAECAKLMYKLMELFGMLEYDPEAKDPPCLTCPYSR